MTKRYKQPPKNVAEANLLKGTRTWGAEHGVYATCVQNDVSNPLLSGANTGVVGDYIPTVNVLASNVLVGSRTTVSSGVAPDIVIPVAQQILPFDTTGAFFTGLSNATVLTVKLKVYVERAPTPYESSLAVLATPSAGYDVTALELYSHAISQLPVAVTVSENGLGDWFRGVLNVIKNVAGGVGGLLNPYVPGAGLVGTAVQQIAGGMDALVFKKPKSSPKISSSVFPTMRKPFGGVTRDSLKKGKLNLKSLKKKH
jgi:hypothetical protein